MLRCMRVTVLPRLLFGLRRVKRERGARAYLLKAAAAPATVSGERRPSCHCRATGGKAEAMRMSREPGDLPAPVAHHLRGACS